MAPRQNSAANRNGLFRDPREEALALGMDPPKSNRVYIYIYMFIYMRYSPMSIYIYIYIYVAYWLVGIAYWRYNKCLPDV